MKYILTILISAFYACPAMAAEHHKHRHVHGFEYGEPGDPAKLLREITIKITDQGQKMLFEPAQIEVKRGEQIKFIVNNEGALDHEFVLGTVASNLEHAKMMLAMPDMAHHDVNAAQVASGKSGTLVWRFSKAGVFDFSCLIPGHREAGMSGTILVKPAT